MIERFGTESGTRDSHRIRRMAHLLCLCGHRRNEHVVACLGCDCTDFRLGAHQPSKLRPTASGNYEARKSAVLVAARDLEFGEGDYL